MTVSKKPCWCKIMMLLIYAICLEIILYAEIVMWVKHDLSALYALIGVPAAMFGVFWAYAEKARAENTKGGITYDAVMLQGGSHTGSDLEAGGQTIYSSEKENVHEPDQ